MYRHHRIRRQSTLLARVSPFGLAKLCIAVALTFSATAIPRFEERRVQRGFHVSLHQSSPPYAALETELLDPDALSSDREERTIALEAGRESLEPQVVRIRSEAVREAREWLEEGRRVADQILSRDQDAARAHRQLDAVIRGMKARLQEAEDVAQIVARAEVRAPVAAPVAPVEAEPVRAASGVVLRRQAFAAIFAPVVAQGGPELAEHFAKAAGATPEESVRAGFVVSQMLKEDARAGRAPTVFAVGRPPNAPARSPSRVALAPPTQAGLSSFSAASVSEALALAALEPEVIEAQPQIVISGDVEMIEGLAVTNAGDRIAVFHEVNGELLESGSVSMRDGRYEILIAARKGMVTAELRSPAGEALGRGSVEVSSLGPASGRFRYDQINLKLKPVPAGFAGRVAGADAWGASPDHTAKNSWEPQRGVELDFESLHLTALSRADGAFKARDAFEGSSAIVRARKAGFWNALAYVSSGFESTVAMLASKSVAALLGLVAPQTRESAARSEQGLAWGKVARDGHALAGAVVELLTGEEGTRAIYFDESMRPDPTLSQTSANGAFAFFPVRPGVQMAQASFEGELSETVVFPAEPGATVRTDIDMAFNRRVDVNVFDAFRTSFGLPSRVASFGRENVIDTDANGQGWARFSSSEGLTFLEVDSGSEYVAARFSVPRDRKAMVAPMVTQAWLDRLAARVRAASLPKTGIAIGFVQGDRPYRARLGSVDGKDQGEVVYFDSSGGATDENFGRPGGGFVIFNAPEGLRTVAVEPAQSQKQAFQIILVEKRAPSIATFWLR